jgi:hypothetical protein
VIGPLRFFFPWSSFGALVPLEAASGSDPIEVACSLCADTDHEVNRQKLLRREPQSKRNRS